MNSILETRNLTKHYDHLVVVNNLNFTVNTGEIVGLIGPDGSGKTTSLRMICGILPPTRGTVEIDNKDVYTNPESVRTLIGYMPQKFSLYVDLTVEENLTFFADMYQVPQETRQVKMKKLYEFSRLEPFRHRLAQHLSGGMQKKLALACNLIHTPKLLILDEPTTGVDPLSRRELWDMLYQLTTHGTSILITTPYMDEVERCHRIGLMYNGTLRSVGTPEQLRRLKNKTLIEIQTNNNRQTKRLLTANVSLTSVYLTGNALHIVTNFASEESINQITNLCKELNITLNSIQPIIPSFEDVFIDLIRNPVVAVN